MLSLDLRCRRLSHAPGQGHCFVRIGSNSGAGTLFYPHLTMISRHQQYSSPKMNNIPHPRQSSKKTKRAIKNETPIPRNPNSPSVPLLTSRDRIPPLSPRLIPVNPYFSDVLQFLQIYIIKIRFQIVSIFLCRHALLLPFPSESVLLSVPDPGSTYLLFRISQ